MLKERRQFVIIKIKDLWSVVHSNKKIASGFKTKQEAESYKQLLRSR